jgi:hypothetical protein
MVLEQGVREAYNHGCTSIRCPLGSPSSRVWVRETWSPDGREHIYPFPAAWYRADFTEVDDPAGDSRRGHTCNGTKSAECWACWGFRWRSPVTMPRWASRIELEITAVRVVRVDGVWFWDVDWKRVDCRVKAALEG